MDMFSDLTDQTAGVVNGTFISDPFTTTSDLTLIHVFAEEGDRWDNAVVDILMSTRSSDTDSDFSPVGESIRVNHAYLLHTGIGSHLKFRARSIGSNTTLQGTTATGNSTPA